MAAGTGASDAHHSAPKQCKRNPAPYVGHDLRVVALVEVADLSREAFQEAVTMRTDRAGRGEDERAKEPRSTLMIRSSYSSCFRCS